MADVSELNNNRTMAIWGFASQGNRWMLFAPAVVSGAVLLGVLPLVHFSLQRGGTFGYDAYIFRVLMFTLSQAGLSTLLSVGMAIPVARAMVRQRFYGQNFLRIVFAVPLVLPVIVALLGITALYGNNGLWGGHIPLYGFWGIVFAHVFFNLPLSVRLLSDRLEATTPEQHRLAAQLNFDDRAVWRLVDWPTLRPTLTRVAALVFMLCAASFVIVLTLGGASATTLEVAIYHSLRLDFDVSRALSLSSLQIILSGILVWLAGRFLWQAPLLGQLQTQNRRFDGNSLLAKSVDAAALTIATLIVLPPLIAVALAGVLHVNFTTQLLYALLSSFALGAAAALLAVVVAWPLAQLQAAGGKLGKFALLCGIAGFMVPPAVMATGWFLAFRFLDGGVGLAATLIVCLNALMALPFMLTGLAPAAARSNLLHDKLCASLGIVGWARLALIDLPSMKPVLFQALLMGFVLSLGDLSAVTLLGSHGLVTMPGLIAQQMGNYRSADAGGSALMLAAICLALTALAHRLGKQG